MIPSSIKNKILSTYAQNTSDIGEVELEARFGTFYYNKFNPGVNRQVFNRIKNYFDARLTPINLRSTDYIMGKVRKTIIGPQNNKDNDQVLWITKQRIWNSPDKNYGIRYSMSNEDPVEAIPEDVFVPDIIREKNRSTYLVFGNAVRIDITLVNMIQGSSSKNSKSKTKDDVTYEVEIELVNPSKIDLFEKAIIVTLRLILDSIKLYTETERKQIVDYTNYVLGSKKRGILDHYPLVQARNLKVRDMVYGGLIGNNKTGYSVTHKADGNRKLLVFHRSGIWLVMAPNFVNLISKQQIPYLYGCILDGELIPMNKRLEGASLSKIWFLAFDALAWNDDASIQTKHHGQRMQYAQMVSEKTKDVLDSSIISIDTKSFKNFSTPQEFFKVMRDMFRTQPLLVYQQDGFMFTPQNTEYNPNSDKNPLYKRILTQYPDICKWKPKEQLTMDFQIKWEILPDAKRRIILYTSKKGKPILFRGSSIFPYNDEIDSEHPLTNSLPNNTIVEYGWDYEKELLYPHLVRNNKTKPNKLDIVEDIWNDIHIPLDAETMKGNTFTLLRKYHNRIKKKLFNSVDGKYLLDIGSGKGGDINKWRKFDKIVAVEPNSEHIEELKRRLKSAGIENKVFILQAGGEDTEQIQKAVKKFIGGRVDVVSMMLSLTFFWQSQSLVKALSNTIITNIKPQGKYIFFTMDGNLVEQTFEPAFDTGPILTGIEFKNLGPAKLEYFPNKNPKELHIDIKNTIVTDQTEWLVRLDDLFNLLGEYGFSYPKNKDIHKADEEKFLTNDEIIMTQMYTYGKSVAGKNLLPDSVEKVKIELNEKQYVLSPTADLPDNMTDMLFSQKPLPKIVDSFVNSPLPPLPPLAISSVTVSVENEEQELPIIKMDSYEPISISWYNKEDVVRIGAIGDGSCFFHAVLNGYLKSYQLNSDINYRADFVRKLRRDIAETLSIKNENGKTNWETTAGGQFVALYEQQQMGVDFTDIFGQSFDFSLDGMYKLINSSAFLGDEIYKYASDRLGLDIYIMRLTDKDLYLHSNTSQEGIERRSVIISGNGSHYETIGIERNGLFQTLFEYNDPFLVKIKSMIKK